MVFRISAGTSSPADVAPPTHDVSLWQKLGEQAFLKHIFLSLFLVLLPLTSAP